MAFEHYLESHPDAVGKVVLIQVAMATAEENEKQGDVMDLVSRVNARFSLVSRAICSCRHADCVRSQPVVFLHLDVSFSQYLALLTVAEVFINSSLREGMNVSRTLQISTMLIRFTSLRRTNTSSVKRDSGVRFYFRNLPGRTVAQVL